MYHVLTEKVFDLLPDFMDDVVRYCTSPGIVIPVLVLLVLVIYYLVSLTGLLRESNEDLKNQLHHERTEERRKLLQSKQGGGAGGGDLSERWKKLLGSAMNSARASSDLRKASGAGAAGIILGFNERAVDVPGESRSPPPQTAEGRAGAMMKRFIRARRARKAAEKEREESKAKAETKETVETAGADDSVGSFRTEGEEENGNDANGGVVEDGEAETAPQTPAGAGGGGGGGSLCNR